MTNILNKPYTQEEYANFVIASSDGKRIEIDDSAAYALLPTEKLVNGSIVDISSTEDYKAQVLSAQNTIRKNEIQAKINELDYKSIRALREGGYIYSATSTDASYNEAYPKGLTYVDYYGEQISTLRAEIQKLN